MLGTDGFGNLLPFMPIKQDWFFKYRYGFAYGNYSGTGYGTTPQYILYDSLFGDDDEICLILVMAERSPNGYDNVAWSVKNSCGYSVIFKFGVAQCYKYENNLSGSLSFISPALLVDTSWDNSGSYQETTLINDGVYKIGFGNHPDDIVISIVALMLSKS